ncbi:hypothetical protein TNCV_2803441 [Trichonephila clavipes]|nr:hypothetical protein TNCV_2803441 [Trichonephila clavipes]
MAICLQLLSCDCDVREETIYKSRENLGHAGIEDFILLQNSRIIKSTQGQKSEAEKTFKVSVGEKNKAF